MKRRIVVLLLDLGIFLVLLFVAIKQLMVEVMMLHPMIDHVEVDFYVMTFSLNVLLLMEQLVQMV
jgi:hypothetical protein